MKYFLLLLTCYFAVLAATPAQEYMPTVVQGAQWNSYEWFESGSTNIMKIDGDTLVNELVYNKLSDPNYGMYALLREDSASKRIYIRGTDSDNILYDYSLNVGDTFLAPERNMVVYALILDSIKEAFLPNTSVTLSVDSPKVYYFKQLGSSLAQPVIWIEGIGSVAGLLHPGYAFFGNEQTNSVLICHFLNDAIDYHFNGISFIGRSDSCFWNPVGIKKMNGGKLDLNVLPNPAVDQVKIRITGDDVNFAQLWVTDITGRLFLQGTIRGTQEVNTLLWPPGIYLVRIITRDGNIRVRKLVIEQ